jgi:hypothetical protein
MYVNDALPAELLSPNSLHRYVSFDIRALWNNWDIYDSKVKDSFWTATFIGLTSGDYNMRQMSVFAMGGLQVVLFIMVIFVACGMFYVRGKRAAGMCLSYLFYETLFMLSYNYMHPYSCNHNARLWLPVLFPAAVLSGLVMNELLQGRPALRRAVCVAFSLAIVVFYADLLFV